MASGTRSTADMGEDGHDHFVIKQFRLRVTSGEQKGVTYTTRAERVVIGGHESNDLVLRDPTVSGFHCEIRLVDGKPILRDLGSRNGTYVDGVAVVEAPLKSGMTLALGRAQLAFDAGKASVRVALSEKEQFGLMVGSSQAMRAVFARLEQAAASESTVLLLGETGTGKDVAAESIYRESARKNGPFVVVDCGAMAKQLVESELFGHERGAFTGADRTRRGAFETAHGGVLFLDELQNLELDLQPKLLRVLERKEIQRVGGTERIPVDVRVIAAANVDLRAEVNAHRFRPDLYYRVAVFDVVIPPLRERPDDLPLLVDELLRGIEADAATLDAIKTPQLLEELRRHAWPGNVRELRNHLERRVALGAARLPPDTLSDKPAPLVDVTRSFAVGQERWARSYFEALLRAHDGNVSQAARAAGLTRTRFYRLLARSGMH
jgi:transcriptional regulator with PAS, ATPase and Fis domain